MTFFSKNILPNKAAIFVAGVALTTIASAYNTSNTSETTSKNTNQATKLVTYTASGKTDVRTARLFRQLMQNNPNIQVTAQVIHKAKQANKRSTYVDVNYTIKGKTDRATVRKLVRLFQTSKHIEVIANIHQKSSGVRQVAKMRFTPNNYAQNYVPNQGYQSYQGYYIQPVTNPTIWYRVPMLPTWTQPYPQNIDITQAPFPMDYSLNIAGK